MTVRAPPWILHRGAHRFFGGTLFKAAEGLDLEVTSYWRSREENERVGGHPFSQHLVGWAIDVVGPDIEIFAERVGAAGLVPVHEIDHLHIQLLPAGALELLFASF